MGKSRNRPPNSPKQEIPVLRLHSEARTRKNTKIFIGVLADRVLQFHKNATVIYKRFQEIGLTFEGVLRALFTPEKIEQLFEAEVFAKVVAAQWFVHESLPVEDIHFGHTEHDITDMFLDHFRENWEELVAASRDRLSQSPVNSVSKAVLLDAMRLHGLGHYRAVVRLVMPEFERLLKQETGSRFFKNYMLKDYIADWAQAELGDTKEARSFGELINSHMFESIGSEQEVAVFASNKIPNRHAVIHGLVDYNGEQESINSILLFDTLISVFSHAHVPKSLGSGEGKVCPGKC